MKASDCSGDGCCSPRLAEEVNDESMTQIWLGMLETPAEETDMRLKLTFG